MDGSQWLCLSEGQKLFAFWDEHNELQREEFAITKGQNISIELWVIAQNHNADELRHYR